MPGRRIDDRRHPSAGVRTSDWRKLYALQHPLAVTLAGGAALAAAILAAMPTLLADTAVGAAFPARLEYAWLAAWGGGGAMALAGYWRLAARLEAPGLILQATAYVVYVVALADQRPVSGLVGLVLAALLGLGMAARAVVILTRPEVMPWDQRR